MAESSSPTPPSSFDPALHLHSELDPSRIPTPVTSNSDELEALNEQQRDLVFAKTENGVVIQHRAWKAAEAFRSDDILNPGSGILGTISFDALANDIQRHLLKSQD